MKNKSKAPFYLPEVVLEDGTVIPPRLDTIGWEAYKLGCQQVLHYMDEHPLKTPQPAFEAFKFIGGHLGDTPSTIRYSLGRVLGLYNACLEIEPEPKPAPKLGMPPEVLNELMRTSDALQESKPQPEPGPTDKNLVWFLAGGVLGCVATSLLIALLYGVLS